MSELSIGDQTFVLTPNIGHCIELEARGIDLLGVCGESQLAKLVANPSDFLKVLETLIASQATSDDYKMPALASFMTGAKWVEARTAVLESLKNFFLDSGYPQTAAALERYRDVADAVTKQVAQSLQSGELRERIDAEVATVIHALTHSD